MLEESLELSGSFARADRLPRTILKALHRLNALPSSDLALLKPKERVTISFLIRCTSCSSPLTPIKIRKNLLAYQVGVSERTLYRILTTLNSLGIIRRHTQQIDRQGGAKVSEISWSETFSNLLFTSSTPQRSQSEKLISDTSIQSKTAPRSDMAYTSPDPSDFNANLADACRNSQFNKRQSLGDSAKQLVPSDCSDLLKWLDEKAIFKLMKIYSSQKKRLGEFVQAALPHIEKANNVFAYLCSIGLSAHKGIPYLVSAGASGKLKSQSRPDIGISAEMKPSDPCLTVGASLSISDRAYKCLTRGLVEIYEGDRRIGSMPWKKALQVLPQEVIKALSATAG